MTPTRWRRPPRGVTGAGPAQNGPTSSERRWRAAIGRLGSSRFNYWFGYVANAAIVGLLLWRAWASWDARDSLPAAAGWACLGLGAWTLAEYLMHRFVYHVWPSFLSIGHGMHHGAPRQLIGVPWYLTSLAAVAIHAALLRVGRPPPVAIAQACAWLGYIGYCLCHHGSHHWSMPGSWLRGRKRYHMLHHAHPNHNWGFTTSLWDRVFGTHWSSRR